MTKDNFKNATKTNAISQTLKDLATTRENWEANELARSNETLYSLLADCLGVYSDSYLSATENERKAIREMVTKSLIENGVKVQINSQIISMFIKLVFGSDRKRADKYAFVLRIAIEEKQTKSTFAQWIKDAGGIEQVKRNTVPTNETIQKREAIAKATQAINTKIDDARINSLGTVSLSPQTKVGNINLVIADAKPDGSLRVIGVLPDVSDNFLIRVHKEMARVEVATSMTPQSTSTIPVKDKKTNYLAKIRIIDKQKKSIIDRSDALIKSAKHQTNLAGKRI